MHHASVIAKKVRAAAAAETAAHEGDDNTLSIVIEFLLRLKIHNIGRPTCVPRFDIENLVFKVNMVNYETLAMQCHAEIFILCATRPM